MNNIYKVLFSALYGGSLDVFLYIYLVFNVCAFIFILCLKHARILDSKKSKTIYTCISIPVYVLYLCLNILLSKSILEVLFYALLPLVILPIIYPILSIEIKSDTSPHKLFLEKLDRQLEMERGIDVQEIKCRSIEKEKPQEIDFTHVKNIIARLKASSIDQEEIKQVNEINKSILYAEKYGIDNQNRGQINDSLGILLKIMARHNI